MVKSPGHCTRFLGGIFSAMVFGLLILVSAASAKKQKMVVSIQNLDCQSCAVEVMDKLKNEKLVKKAEFDLDKVEVSLVYKGGDSQKEKILKVFADDNLQYKVGAGFGYYEKVTDFPEGVDAAIVEKRGGKVDIAGILVPGKVTVVDFYADWCGPCRDVDAAMIEVMQKNSDVALRKINIQNWKTPVVKQHLKNVQGLPYVRVYSKSGTLVENIYGVEIEKVKKTIDKTLKN